MYNFKTLWIKKKEKNLKNKNFPKHEKFSKNLKKIKKSKNLKNLKKENFFLKKIQKKIDCETF